MKNHFSPQFSDEDLDLYLVGKVTPNLTARIEEHYFGTSATGYPSEARPWEAIIVAATLASVLLLVSFRMNQKPHVQTIASAITTPALPFASAIAASIDLFAPALLPVPEPAVRRPPQAEPRAQRLFQPPPQQPRSMVRIAMVDPPTVVIYSKSIPGLPFEPETPRVSGPKKSNRLRRFLSGAAAPVKFILLLDRYNRGA